MGIPIDIETLRLNVGKAKSVIAAPKKRATGMGNFIKGPIPLDWIMQIAALEGRAMNLAIGLWFLAGVTKSRTFSVTRKTYATFGITRKTAARLLPQMQSAGLIRIDQKRGRAPVVTIITDNPTHVAKKENLDET